jgi:hypothetical protein
MQVSLNCLLKPAKIMLEEGVELVLRDVLVLCMKRVSES